MLILKEFEIFFLNNGDAIFQVDEFVGHYSSMEALAADFNEYQLGDQDVDTWEGSDESLRIDYDYDAERNGHYEVLNEVCWDELPELKGCNSSSFYQAICKLRPDFF